MNQAKPATRVCGACKTTRLSGYNPGTASAGMARTEVTGR
jgi:hypothetical protein